MMTASGRPFNSCPADATRGGCVNVDDLLVVINGWGTCAAGSICWGNLDGDCDVDVDDMVAVINGWCDPACANPELPQCATCEQCQQSFMGGSPSGSEGESSGGLTLAELIVIVTQSSASTETQAEIIAELLQNY